MKRPLAALAPAFLLVISVCFAAGTSGGRTAEPPSGPVSEPSTSPMNEPDKFAWQLFARLCRPAGNDSNDAYWETWARQTDVYGDPDHTPMWPSATHRPLQLNLSVQQTFRTKAMAETGNTPDDPDDAIPSEEVRMNRPTLDYIVDNHLWYREGQEALYASGKPFDFPTSSIEVKAKWKRITEADKPRYHWQIGQDGKLYGLVGLHIMTKDIPNWFWATFEQEDNPQRGKILPLHDDFGLSPGGRPSPALAQLFHQAGLGPEWTHYRLDGSQTEYTDSTGRPILLGSSVIEKHFVATASCMTCHAMSAINVKGYELPFFKPDGQSYNGVPNPTLFYKPGTNQRLYAQRDFVWSLSLAKNRSGSSL